MPIDFAFHPPPNIAYYLIIVQFLSLPIIMGRPGDITQSWPLSPSKRAFPSEKNSSDHSKASTDSDAERSFPLAVQKRRPEEKAFWARQQRSSEENALLAQSIATSPKVAANSDGDQCFFRMRTQWLSGTGTSSVGSTSPMSPFTTLAPRNSRKVERQSLVRSEASLNVLAVPKPVAYVPNLKPTICEALTKGSPEARPSPTPQTSRSSTSSSSAAGVKTQILPKIHLLQITPNAAKNGPPPREVKDKHKRKRETSGHWLEIRKGRKRRSDESQAVSAEGTTEIRSTRSPLPLGQDQPHSGREMLPVQSSPSTGTTFSKSTTIASQEGLYCRTRRRLGLKKGPVRSVYSEPPSKTHTGGVLQEASDVLREVVERKGLLGETSSIITTTTSIASSRSVLSRLLPGYRRTPHSTSSSVRNLMMGKAPEPSPDPEAMYVGPDANTYFRIEIAGPDGFTFLPSEARKIDTPPLSHAKRGFFFNYSKPPEEKESSPESGVGSSPGATPGGTIRKRKKSGIDWYKLKEAADEAKDARVEMEFNLPEHLPSSPLCPRNSKHKSGGRGVCAHHGRNRTSSSAIEIRDKI